MNLFARPLAKRCSSHPAALSTAASQTLDLQKILLSGQHACPGCGAKFHIDNAPEHNGTAPPKSGWINFGDIKGRLGWNNNAPPHSPKIYIVPRQTLRSPSSAKANGSVYDRQANWLARQYTRVEMERIQKRDQMAAGEATERLRRLRQSNSDEIRKGVPKSANSRTTEPLFRDLITEGDQWESIDQLAHSMGAVDRGMLGREVSEKKAHPLICQRCHDLSNPDSHSLGSFEATLPGEASSLRKTGSVLDLLSEEEISLLRQDLNWRSLIVLMADLTDLPGSIPAGALDLMIKPVLKEGDSLPNVLLVGNKLDLMPKNCRKLSGYFADCVRDRVGEEWKDKIMGTWLVSAKEGLGLDQVCQHILKVVEERDGNVFLVGRTNVGKSFLFNQLLGPRQRSPVTVSAKAGTTVGMIRAQLGGLRKSPDWPSVPNRRVLVDLPGIFDGENSLIIRSALTQEETKKALISKRIRQSRRVLQPGETALLAGLIRIECIGNDPTVEVRLKLYMRPDWPYFRVASGVVEEFVAEHLGQHRPQPPHLMPPHLLDGPQDPRWELFSKPKLAASITVQGKNPSEFSFSDGLGWISAHLAEADQMITLNIYTPAGVGVTPRSLLPYDHRA